MLPLKYTAASRKHIVTLSGRLKARYSAANSGCSCHPAVIADRIALSPAVASCFQLISYLFQPITNEPPKEFDPDEPQQPLIFLISGRRKDLPSAMVQRIQEQIAPEFIGIRAGTPTTLP
jgi:hypothetical protein